jgi:hypothetical protein
VELNRSLCKIFLRHKIGGKIMDNFEKLIRTGRFSVQPRNIRVLDIINPGSLVANLSMPANR